MKEQLTLYGMMSPNVSKIVLMLSECGLAFDFHHLDVISGAQFSPEFLALNPNNKAPVLVEAGDPPMVTFESAAILIRLAEREGRFLASQGPDRYSALQWLAVQISGVGPTLGQLRHFSGAAPEALPYAVERFRSEAIRLFDVFNLRLIECGYLAGADYSIADIALYPWIADTLRYRAAGKDFGLDPQRQAALIAWAGAVASRAAAGAMQAFMDDVARDDRRSIAAASEDDMDRIFGRGRWRRGPAA